MLFGEGEFDGYGVPLSTHGSAYLLELPEGILVVKLLASAVGRGRVAAEPEVARLAGLRDGLPLALRITAAQPR
ncbi:hypothetical protein ACFVYD_03605 [Streptomyces sp. NPDC058301]|uniref:hypothetical protein n=1 Tax=Streptomyces sp. NPDC058301 TaxID=3346436 RepID=UPI0036EE4B56